MKILITGGLGFIGVNAAIKLSNNNEIYILDNFSRKGNQENLKEIDENKIKIIYRDIRNFFDMEEVFILEGNDHIAAFLEAIENRDKLDKPQITENAVQVEEKK
jgi:nucleoside-diphosphate-sugar epimerase